MLTPVTTANSGRVPAWLQPFNRPAPNAPSAPPPEIASHGPLTCGSMRANSVSESPHARAFGMPRTTAASLSATVKGARTAGCSFGGTGGGFFFVTFFFDWVCA